MVLDLQCTQLRRGVWDQENFEYEVPSERLGADLEHIINIFKNHFLGTLMQICENSVFSDYELFGDRPGPRKY